MDPKTRRWQELWAIQEASTVLYILQSSTLRDRTTTVVNENIQRMLLSLYLYCLGTKGLHKKLHSNIIFSAVIRSRAQHRVNNVTCQPGWHRYCSQLHHRSATQLGSITDTLGELPHKFPEQFHYLLVIDVRILLPNYSHLPERKGISLPCPRTL